MNFTQAIRFAVLRELVLARRAAQSDNYNTQFKHFENAHILGQASIYWHTYVHWLMLYWGWQNQDLKEVVGQLIRVVGAVTKTTFGWLPSGNTGGANISAFTSLPLADEHRFKIKAARIRMR